MDRIPKPQFIVLPGWIIAKPYISKEQTFISEKESSGDAGKSEVLFVGDEYIDDNSNKRTTEVKVGDVILHIYSQNSFELGFDKYRAVHFSQVISIIKEDAKR